MRTCWTTRTPCRGPVGCSLRIGRAFSLIEVLVALSIFVVLAGLALPSLTNWSPKLVDGAVISSIQASLDSARAIALERGDVVSVRVVRSADGPTVLLASWANTEAEEESGAEEIRRPLMVFEGSFRLLLATEEDEAPAPTDMKPPAATDDVLWNILPDGTVRSTGRIELHAPPDRMGEVTVSSWSGRLTVGPLLRPEDQDIAADEDEATADEPRPSTPPETPKDAGEGV